MGWSIEQAADVALLTREYIDKEIQKTFKEPTYQLFNMMMSNTKDISGKLIASDINLKDEGNSKQYDNPWEADQSNVENITYQAQSNWKFFKSNVSFNNIELAMNQGPEQIHDYMKNKVENAVREMADTIQPQLVLSPTGSGDQSNLTGLASWFPNGTDDSTGGFNSYSARYNDGSGTTFNAGGISSSASDKPRWAAYYADHNGKLGDNLLDRIDDATLQLGFINPVHPEVVGTPLSWSGFKFFTSAAVIRNIRTLLRKSDDGLRALENYQGVPLYNGIPMVYVPTLDTARANLYGTNPFWGINMDLVKVYTLRGFKFVKDGPRKTDANHNVIRIYWDLVYNIHCKDRRRGGFLISQQ